MLFQKVNRSDADKVFVVVQNVSAATITAGYPCVYDVTSPDGVRVSQPATATLSCFVGIAVSDIADSAYGLVQAYGYKSQAYLTNDTSVAVAAGDLLVPTNGQWYLSRAAAGNGTVVGGALLMAAQSFVTATAGAVAAANKKVFIRAL